MFSPKSVIWCFECFFPTMPLSRSSSQLVSLLQRFSRGTGRSLSSYSNSQSEVWKLEQNLDESKKQREDINPTRSYRFPVLERFSDEWEEQGKYTNAFGSKSTLFDRFGIEDGASRARQKIDREDNGFEGVGTEPTFTDASTSTSQSTQGNFHECLPTRSTSLLDFRSLLIPVEDDEADSQLKSSDRSLETPTTSQVGDRAYFSSRARGNPHTSPLFFVKHSLKLRGSTLRSIRSQDLSETISIRSGYSFAFSTASNAGVSTESEGLPEIDKTKRTEGTPKVVVASWIEKVLPKQLQPFAHLARLDKPIGTWLLAWPCFWSIALAAPAGSSPDLQMLALFGLGAVLLRGAGCTVNDLLDRDIDGKVERTRLRPFVSGALTPFQGLAFLGCQLLLGLGILLQLNMFSQVLGASSLLLVGTYPLMKRWTFWPQAFLGLTFNWGALLGWAAVRGGLDFSIVFPLYLSGVCWTLVYDTIYAHQDKDDDQKVGVKSTALRFGEDTRPWLTGFSTACVSSLSLAGYNSDLGWPFYVGVAATAGHLAWQVSSVNTQCRVDCNAKFVSNKWLGAMVFSGIVFGKLVS